MTASLPQFPATIEHAGLIYTVDACENENGNRFVTVSDSGGAELGAAAFRVEEGTVALSPFTDADGVELEQCPHDEIAGALQKCVTTGATEERQGAPGPDDSGRDTA